VKSKDGKVDGEIFGRPAAKSKFARLEIGMSRTAAEKLIGVPTIRTRISPAGSSRRFISAAIRSVTKPFTRTRAS